ncbi:MULTISPECIES: AraC family transcriptional regulator [Enterobacteriaceae]|jgi:AraC-like DNA-binding protein|uniref:AraC family transcriptional regulator n=1 Tax=Citrobacter bitternis TaxID=1585982 RepID=A0ABW1PWN8_9ENTR|nr:MULTISPECIES: AraC family transcriptional regulator [Phytobacter]AUU90601.1 AraC family transcriptional regulator [Enterobacteriaceae bacterium ENNIH3]AUV09312.1 AraC family transcriptional regulator [Enterobacteriaceae bacterium ENNIH2]MBS6739253.1 helix-turn-helix transcriptional regulator [Enterobacteriaceae bacterium]PTA89889.1 AraC family transcriptional regulator [Kluyvera sp. Nf5]PWF50936.1 AraC family transcriptional regulator [[Kluyvera] intestini]
MSDPLTDIVTLLNPRPTHTKLVEGAGQWRIVRESCGEAFYCAVLQGECLISINGKAPKLLVSGDFILIPATYTFENTNAGTSAPTDITTPTLIGDGHVRIGATTGPAEFLMNVGHCEFDTPDKQLIVALLPNEILVKGQQRFVTLLELLLDESQARRPGREVVLMRLLQLLLVESLRSHDCLSGTAGILRGLQHEKIAIALHLIHEKPDIDWQIAQLASHCAMSRSSFFAIFNETVGMPPMQYLLFWRMSLARKALLSSTDKIEQIAFRIGYQSASAFNVAFTKYVGMPPGVFRRQKPHAISVEPHY